MIDALSSGSETASVGLGDEARLSIDGLDDLDARVLGLRGTEAANELYGFDIVFSASFEQRDLRPAALGRKVTLDLALPDGSRRYVRGVAVAVELLAYADGRALVCLALAPRLWFLTQRKDSRVFQDMNVREVVTEVLLGHGVAHAWSLARPYERRAYCVQYAETDFEFATRLLAEEGIFYFFEHPADAAEAREHLLTTLAGTAVDELAGVARSGASLEALGASGRRLAPSGNMMQMLEVSGPTEILVFGDTPAAYASLAGAEALDYRPDVGAGALDVRETHVGSLRVGGRIVPTRATVRGYDPWRAAKPPAGTVIGTTSGVLGSLADAGSAGVEALGGASGELHRAAGPAMGSMAGAIGGAAGGALGDPAEALGQTTNESFAYGIRTATHAVMPPDRALGRAGIGLATAGLQAAVDDAGWDQVFGAAGGIGQALLADSEDALEHYDHHGDHEELGATFAAAKSRLEQHRVRHLECAGTSRCRRLLPGKSFTLRGHELAAVNVAYVLVAVRHELGAADASTPLYRNAFRAVPATVPMRPPRPAKRMHQTVESATVVGPASAEIETERRGRVKVQFHWDRKGKHDENSSCFLRVMQAWSGTGYGFQFIPRIGTEVLVSFVGGDIDRPVVVGSLPNLATPLPYPLPERKTQSGIRTQTSPEGGGYNELMFEDERGAEEVHLRAERDLTEEIRRNHETRVGEDHRLQVQGGQRIDVERDRALTVGGAYTESVRGMRREDVDGDSSRRAAGHALEASRGSRSADIGGDDLVAVGGDATLRVGGARYELVDGEALRHVGGNAVTSVAGGAVLSGARLALRAEREIVLSCGDSTLVIKPDEVIIAARTVRVVGEERVVMAQNGGAALTLTADAELHGANVTVLSSGAALRLGGDARLGGGQVHLGSGDAAASSRRPSDERRTQPFSVRLSGPGGRAYANCRYVLRAGGEELAGTTDGDGRVRQDVAADAASGEVTVWPGDYPNGPRESWSLTFGALEDTSSPAGASARLRNLGYASAPAPAAADEAPEETAPSRESLRRFQRDRGLEETGELDMNTVSALRSAHD
ncbi:MAG: type VI secretion system tip protein VgrG [Polyangiaceae bacterium]|nr:type VI secretion system tip protein VgrG [Polyangiaceae bacterium]